MDRLQDTIALAKCSIYVHATGQRVKIQSVGLAPQFTWYTVYWVSRVLLLRDCFLVVYIFALDSSLNTAIKPHICRGPNKHTS